MNFIIIGMLIMQAARLACGTCVFESDYGFILNCNFKKSGLFRVRNLGGLKAHFGLGFSLGDELGFPEALGETDSNRRRAISYKNGAPSLVSALPSVQQLASNQGNLNKNVAPSFVGALPSIQKPAQYAIPDKRITSRSTGPLPSSARSVAPIRNSLIKQAAIPPPLMTEARPLPLGVPVFRPIPKTAPKQVAQRRTDIAVVDSTNPRVSFNNKLVESYSQPVHSNRTFHVANPVVSQPVAVPAFQVMPDSISRIANVKTKNSNSNVRIANNNPNYLQFEEPKFDLKDVTVEELAAAANVSVATIKHAIYVREQQMKAEHRAMLASRLREEFIRTSTTARTTTTTTSTTSAPLPPMEYFEPIPNVALHEVNQNLAYENKMSKVMNAPKEYYPVAYDKNFDDNFKSKVDLPPTSFSCGTQKHFPGLYADTDLGCMVFHVCALTDDGLVRKSFLCPENTLFDQTILKCNWWFYVDCNASKSVYDSNIPISKSYQLMKSLTYFSKYAKNKDDDTPVLDIQTLKESMDDEARNSKEKNKAVEVTPKQEAQEKVES